MLDPPPFTGTPAQLTKGSVLYGRYYFMCHGPEAIGGGCESPDLRFSGALRSPERSS